MLLQHLEVHKTRVIIFMFDGLVHCFSVSDYFK